MPDGNTPGSDAFGEQQVPAAAAAAGDGATLKDTAEREKARGSRLTRILLGVLLLALAVFIWVNYVWLPGQNSAALPETAEPPPAVPLRAGTTDAQGGTDRPAAADPATSAGATGTDAGDGPAMADLPSLGDHEAADPAGTEADGAPFVAPDLTVTDLPLLVTTPPPPEAEVPVSDAPTASRAARLLEGPNPFSPVHLALPPEEFTPAPAPEPAVASGQQEPVLDVSVPAGPGEQAVVSPATGAPAATPAAPSSADAAPSAPQMPAAPDPVPVPPVRTAGLPAADAGSTGADSQAPSGLDLLPRPLPGPALSSVPAVLQETRSPASAPARDPAAAAALQEPPANAPAPDTETVADTAATDGSADVPVPEALPPAALRVVPAGSDPLVAGATPLSRYLRDNGVTFTGLVLGPISHGVFKLGSEPRPLVLALGKNLPETEITLTDLSGQQAEFTLADSTQSLTLDLGR